MELKLLLLKRLRLGEILFLLAPAEEKRLRGIVAQNSARLELQNEGTVTIDDMDVRKDRRCLKRFLALARQAKTVVLAKSVHSMMIAEAVCEAHLQGMRIIDFDSSLLELEPCVPSRTQEFMQMFTQKNLRQDVALLAYDRLKTVLEPWVALALLLILAPLFLLVAIAVKMTSRGPAIYSQIRVGHRGKPFRILKFRTMKLDAEKNGPCWATAELDDQRLTSIGNFLRKSHLDELPQLVNVLRGELAFIGPRPERPVFVKQLVQEIPLFQLRTLIKPGITGWAQVHFGYANSVSDSRRKVEFDLFYLVRRSPVLDVQVFFKTIKSIFKGGTEGKKREILSLVTK